MSEVANEQVITQVDPEQNQPVETNAANAMAESLWNIDVTPYQNPMQQPASQEPPVAENKQDAPAVPDEEVLGLDDYFQREFGFNATDFRTKWDEFNKPKEPVAPQEHKWVYDDSKEDEIYNYIHNKREIGRLEKLEITNENQAAEILRANLQFKYKGTLEPNEIDRIFSKQYSLPAKPIQTLEQSDDDYAASIQQWESQIAEKKMDMIIEAKMAKPDLLKYKEQIVLPNIEKPQVQQQGPTQEELAAREAGRQAYLSSIESGYQNFKGFSVTAKDGDVQLPISYGVNQEEVTASKQTLENFDTIKFFSDRWFDENGNPKVTLMQEDLYLLLNRDKVHQKIANEAAAQMKLHLIKNQNNINLSGVNPALGNTNPLKQEQPKSVSQQVGDAIWAL